MTFINLIVKIIVQKILLGNNTTISPKSKNMPYVGGTGAMEEKIIILTVVFQKEDDGCWTAECKELGTAMFGDSFEEAQEAISEAICLQLEGHEQVGELEQFLQDNKVKIYTRKKVPKSVRVSPSLDPTHFELPYTQAIHAHAGIC